jgi:hypothetical protein
MWYVLLCCDMLHLRDRMIVVVVTTTVSSHFVPRCSILLQHIQEGNQPKAGTLLFFHKMLRAEVAKKVWSSWL